MTSLEIHTFTHLSCIKFLLYLYRVYLHVMQMVLQALHHYLSTSNHWDPTYLMLPPYSPLLLLFMSHLSLLQVSLIFNLKYNQLNATGNSNWTNKLAQQCIPCIQVLLADGCLGLLNMRTEQLGSSLHLCNVIDTKIRSYYKIVQQ